MFVDDDFDKPSGNDKAGDEVGEKHLVEFEEFAGEGPEEDGDKKKEGGEGKSDDGVYEFVPGVVVHGDIVASSFGGLQVDLALEAEAQEYRN